MEITIKITMMIAVKMLVKIIILLENKKIQIWEFKDWGKQVKSGQPTNWLLAD